jgi:uncharacterized protein (UPF0332 family)
MGCCLVLDELVRISAQLRIDKAHECLKDAETMLISGSYATSANRSYYCIFHAMQAVLTTVGFSSKKHSGSIAEFRKSFVKTGTFSEVHSDIIGEAFNVRSKSDYDIHYVVVKTDVDKQVTNAKTFLTAVETYITTL